MPLTWLSRLPKPQRTRFLMRYRPILKRLTMAWRISRFFGEVVLIEMAHCSIFNAIVIQNLERWMETSTFITALKTHGLTFSRFLHPVTKLFTTLLRRKRI